jgi:hypothetical protein
MRTHGAGIGRQIAERRSVASYAAPAPPSERREDRSGMAMSPKFSGPLFVVGMPRSGTKLLRDLLNRHPSIRIPPIETEFLPWLVRHVDEHGDEYGDLSCSEEFQKFYSRMIRFPHFSYMKRDGRLVAAEDWRLACRRHDAAGLFEALLRLETGAAVGDAAIWGDKSPSYINELPLIASLYPQARFLHIIRDARDHCLSIHRAWGKNMRRAAQRWSDSVEAARQAGRSLGGAYMEVRYEDLLEHAEAELRRCCRHVGVDFRPDMTSLERPSENIGDAKGMASISADNCGKFLRAMEPALLRDIEAIAGRTLLDCGYSLTYPLRPTKRLGPLRLKAAQIGDGCNLVLTRKDMGFVEALSFFARYFRATRSI